MRPELSFIRLVYDKTVARALRTVLWMGAIAVVLGLLQLARTGTLVSRIVVATSLLVVVISSIWIRRRIRAQSESDLSLLYAAVPKGAHEERERAVRALSIKPELSDSRALADLHIARSLEAIPQEVVVASAKRRSRTLSYVVALLSVIAFAVVACRPWGLMEGFDVLLAKNGVAPIRLAYLGNIEIEGRAPEYLRMQPLHLSPTDASVPEGTLLSIHGIPIHDGRMLALSDGKTEVPFVDDGSGQVVVRWPVTQTVTLRVLARFGDTIIEDPEAITVIGIADQAPVVRLEGAPKEISMKTGLPEGELPIRYEASDDHGLREVHLVLRSGGREERRALARLDGETREDRGGYLIRETDPFLKKAASPVEVRVEAKDNDATTGPKWGRSEAITLIPPTLGEAEALRFESLHALRDQLVDSLAVLLDVKAKEGAAPSLLDQVRAKDDAAIAEALGKHFGTLRVPSRLEVLLRVQQGKVNKAASGFRASRNANTWQAFVSAQERMVLVVDAMAAGLAFRDTRTVAKKLAESADEIASGASLWGNEKERPHAQTQMDAATKVLASGSESMFRLGSLGRDLGEIVAADLKRIARGRAASTYDQTELAARDLAARLRQPDPSFAAQGGPSESGGGTGSSSDSEGTGDEVSEAFNEAAQELERLASEHAENMAETEQAMQGEAASPDKALRSELKKHADALREAASSLPSAPQRGAEARDQAEQSAKAMEQGQLDDAVQAGERALEAARRNPRGGPNDERAQKEIGREIDWAKRTLESLRAKAKREANVGKQADRERGLGERAKEIAGKGSGALPGEAERALQDAAGKAREASEALRRGDAERGLALQRAVQRDIERARGALGAQEDGKRDQGGEEGQSGVTGRADIPNADAHRSPESWRKRVLKGLSEPAGGEVRDAVKRYGEGLVR